MPAFWMCELSPTEVAISDASRRNQLACRDTLTHDRRSNPGIDSHGGQTLRVLIVDDDRDAADALVRLTGRWGHEAQWAYDGATGLKVAASQHPDVVLLDLEMPFMDGAEVARQLRLDFPRRGCFIIGFTEWFDEGCREQCHQAGIDLVFEKPAAAPPCARTKSGPLRRGGGANIEAIFCRGLKRWSSVVEQRVCPRSFAGAERHIGAQ